MAVKSIDHVAIPIQDVEAMRRFYTHFGFQWDVSGAPRLYAATLAQQKLNFHAPSLWQNEKFTLRAPNAKVGCGDFCLVWEGDLTNLLQHLNLLKIQPELGPVPRQGGSGQGQSVYVRDPDKNLVEFILYEYSSP